jgi:hypothetical protein
MSELINKLKKAGEKPKKKKVTFNIEEDQFKLFKAKCSRLGFTQSEVLSSLFELFIELSEEEL